MNKEDILKKINEIFIDILERNDIVLKDNTTANDIEEWDSLSHIHLVVAIERAFNIRFSSVEIQNWENVGELVQSILKKTTP